MIWLIRVFHFDKRGHIHFLTLHTPNFDYQKHWNCGHVQVQRFNPSKVKNFFNKPQFSNKGALDYLWEAKTLTKNSKILPYAKLILFSRWLLKKLKKITTPLQKNTTFPITQYKESLKRYFFTFIVIYCLKKLPP